MRPIKNTFPINLLIEDCLVVVVGGGRLGLHKVALLEDAGAHVRLVCPVLTTDAILPASVTWREKRFDPTDLEGAVLVFACTDDKYINRAILEAAREACVHCCCADGNWADGDFTTPAIIRTHDLLVGISTNGRSSRQAKLVKEKINSQIEAIESSELYIVGVSHDELTLQQRSCHHLPTPEMRAKIGTLIKQLSGVQEFMVINTCNRVEIVAVASSVTRQTGIIPHVLNLPKEHYTYVGKAAFDHLTLVLSGMKSQVLGEFHIVNQIKMCVNEAETAGWMRGILKEWFMLALRTSRAIRHDFEPLLKVREIETICQNYLHEHGKLRPGMTFVVAGTGMIGKALIAWGLQQNFNCISLYHHNVLPKRLGVQSLQLEAWQIALSQADIFVSAIDVTEPYFDTSHSSALVIDLGAPRNIASTGSLIDLDHLKHLYRSKTGVLEQADLLCAQNLAMMQEECATLQATLGVAP